MAEGETPASGAEAHGHRSRRACSNCAQVKERCAPRAGSAGGACQRCHRLRKTCIIPAPALRAQRRTSRSSQPAKTGSPLPTPPQSIQTPAPSENYSSPGYWEGYAALGTLSDAAPVSVTLDALDDEKKATLFQNYCRHMGIYFPFVLFDSSVTLPETSPFAYAAALVAALHRHPSIQRQISRELLQHIAVSMVVQGQKSLDLLQGILVLLAWYPFYSQRNPQLMNLLHLAQALVVDLGLSRRHTCPILPIQTSVHLPELLHGAAVSIPRDSATEHRALLGFYYVAAQLAVNLRRLEHPQWTIRMEECCQQLENTRETNENNALATHLLRLHVVTGRYLRSHDSNPHKSSINHSYRNSTGERNNSYLDHDVVSFSIREYVRSFTADIEGVQATKPRILSDNYFLQMHRLTMEIVLYDAVSSVPTKTVGEATDKIDAMYSLLSRLDSFFNLACNAPTEDMPHFSVLTWAMLGQASDVLAKLNFLRTDGWDLTRVRAQLNVTEVVERLSDKYLEVYLDERRRYPTLDASPFAVFPLKLRQFRKWYEEKVAKEVEDRTTTCKAMEEMDMEDRWNWEYGSSS